MRRNHACAGDVPTLETLAAVQLLRQHLPELKVRVVNVLDLLKLQPPSEHSHGLSDHDFDMLFTQDKPIIFAYDGYLCLIHCRPRKRVRRDLAITHGRGVHMPTQQVYLIRHGETAWSLSGQHTGTTDIPLTENGRNVAKLLKPVLTKETFTLVLTSPLQRARETCALAGLAEGAEIDRNLMEWNYGEYEGLTSQQIHTKRPGWMVFTDGCPGGESPEQVGARVDRVIAKVRAVEGHVALFAHGHVLRAFAARWLGLPVATGGHFLLDTATLSIMSYYQGIPAVGRWNARLVP